MRSFPRYVFGKIKANCKTLCIYDDPIYVLDNYIFEWEHIYIYIYIYVNAQKKVSGMHIKMLLLLTSEHGKNI